MAPEPVIPQAILDEDPAAATVARCSSLAGATTSKLPSSDAPRHSPPMNSSVGTAGTSTPATV